MKIFTVLLLLLSMSVLAIDEKSESIQNYTVPSSVQSDSVAGDLDGSNTFDRTFLVVDNGGGCDATSSDSSNNGVAYQVFPFYSPSGEMADMEVVLGSLGDSVLFIYCGFNPANPADSLVAWDDDGGVGFGSAIAPAAGIQLQANVVYYAVVSGFGNGDSGTFDLVLGGDLIFGAPEVQSVPTIGIYGIILLLALILLFVNKNNFKLIRQK